MSKLMDEVIYRSLLNRMRRRLGLSTHFHLHDSDAEASDL